MSGILAHESRAIISGIGETEYFRGGKVANTTLSGKQLTLQAAKLACQDAGIETSAIDAVIVPSNGSRPEDLINGLGIRDLKMHAALQMGGANSVAGVALAAAFVNSGLATRVLIARGSTSYGTARLSDPNGGAMSWAFPSPSIRSHIEYPAGCSVPMQWYSLHANRWFYETGADPSGMRTIALATRAHAQRNERAYFRGRPLTQEMYDASPFLTRPFRLHDISQESDGGAAAVVEAASTDQSGRRVQVHVAGGGEGHSDTPDDMSSRPDILDMGIRKVADRVFRQLGVQQQDFDFAQIYDCFTFIVLRQIEEMGFCGRGEGSEWLRDNDIGPGGTFPVNTHGGLLSQAHIGGMNHVAEAVKQLRNEAGEAQIENAQLGLVTGYGNFSDGSLIVLHN